VPEFEIFLRQFFSPSFSPTGNHSSSRLPPSPLLPLHPSCQPHAAGRNPTFTPFATLIPATGPAKLPTYSELALRFCGAGRPRGISTLLLQRRFCSVFARAADSAQFYMQFRGGGRQRWDPAENAVVFNYIYSVEPLGEILTGNHSGRCSGPLCYRHCVCLVLAGKERKDSGTKMELSGQSLRIVMNCRIRGIIRIL